MVRVAELKCRRYIQNLAPDPADSLANNLDASRLSEHRKLKDIRQTWHKIKPYFTTSIKEKDMALMEYAILEEWEVSEDTMDMEGMSGSTHMKISANEFTTFYAYIMSMLIFADVVYLVGTGKLRDIRDLNDRAERLEIWEENISATTMHTFAKLMQHCLVADCVVEAGSVQIYIKKHLARLADDVFRFQVVRRQIKPYWSLYGDCLEDTMKGRSVSTMIDIPLEEFEFTIFMMENKSN